MVNKRFWLGILVMVLVLGMTVAGCNNSQADNNSQTNDNNTRTFTGKDLAGNVYTLILKNSTGRAVANDDSYTMEIKDPNGKTIGSNSGTVTDILEDTAADTITLESSDGTESSVTISDDGVISSIVGEITLADGTRFIVRTFNNIYMRVGRWRNGGYFNEDGDNYASGDSIKLKDIYDGDLNALFSAQSQKKIAIRLSGTVDAELKIHIRLFYRSYDSAIWSDDGSNSQWLGGGEENNVEIGPGDFSEEVYILTEKKDINTFPKGEVHLYLEHIVYAFYPNNPEMNIGDNPIPADIPNGTIMATIRNLKVEPVEIVEKNETDE